jgi:cysteinyl-tRNA synthetase
LFKKNIADLWMHVGHINVNHEKMAKSLNNFILVKDLLSQYSGNDIRWFIYQTRYQNPLEFNKNAFEQSNNELLKIFQQMNYGFIQMYWQIIKPYKSNGTIDEEFVNALNDDLDFPDAKVVISKQIKKLASLIRGKKFDNFQKLIATLLAEFDILGIIYTNPLDDASIKSLVDEWQKALVDKNYILSDKYRKQLSDKKVF